MVSTSATRRRHHPAGPRPRPGRQRARDGGAGFRGRVLWRPPRHSGQSACEFSLGVAGTLALLRSDAETRIAGLLFELCIMEPGLGTKIEERFGKEVATWCAACTS
jgi:hypothetical protein